ncbi:MAG: PAS domain S-box protein [Sandarakinorhabdus sp.]|nr:PAS domain S-box protein [Sandarakinorhabdus sp.]
MRAAATYGIITAGVITDLDRAAEAMFGWQRDQIIGRLMEGTIVPPAFRHAHRNGRAR